MRMPARAPNVGSTNPAVFSVFTLDALTRLTRRCAGWAHVAIANRRSEIGHAEALEMNPILLSGKRRLDVSPIALTAKATLAKTRNHRKPFGRIARPPIARARRRRSATG